MSFPVSVGFATPPVGTCPVTFSEAVGVLNTLITGEVMATFTPYILGSSTPAVEDQDKAWIRTDASGRPLGTYLYYAGFWRKQYNGNLGELRIFSGNPSTYFNSLGRGLVGGEWDGWHLANGQEGVLNLSDHFLVAGHMSDLTSGYSGGAWRTNVSGSFTTSGGAASVTLTTGQIPRGSVADIVVDKFSADANARDNAGLLFGHHSGSTGSSGTEVLVPGTDAASGTPVATLPPYFVVAYCLFVGYQ